MVYHIKHAAIVVRAVRIAAIINARDNCGVIIFAVVFLVECRVANWLRRIIAFTAGRDLVVKVQVLGAAKFGSTVNGLAILFAAAVRCVHFFTIGITLEESIAQVVFIVFSTEMMAANPSSLGIILLATRIGCVI